MGMAAHFPSMYRVRGRLRSRAEKTPFAAQLLCRWLLLRERYRRKQNAFEKDIIGRILSYSTKRVSAPNVDSWRFPEGLHWNMANSLHRTLGYISTNSDHIARAYSRLADARSRDLLLDVLAFRALGPQHVRLPATDRNYWTAFEIAKSWIEKTDGEYGGYNLYSFLIPAGQATVRLSCWLGSIVYTFLMKQYFFVRDGVAIQPECGDIMLDLGACLGDTALAFAIAGGEDGHIYSFDPLPNHKVLFAKNMLKNPTVASRITFVEKAASAKSGEIVSFSESAAGSRCDPTGLLKVGTISIDDFVNNEKLPRVDFIKMDIEGSELSALRGSSDTLRRFCPKLAISIYHRPEDLYQIIEFIGSVESRYQLFIEQYTAHDEEVILYAYVPERIPI
jgi:FkbM family methyltransferase